MLTTFLTVLLVAAVLMFAGAALLHLLPRLGAPGRSLSDAFCRAPALDLAITYFLIVPPVTGAVMAGWLGVLAAVAGQIVALQSWVFLHELAHPEARKGPRIVKSLNRIVGRWRNHTAVWITAIAVPLFWIVRVTQIIVYPPITWLVGLPRYRTGDWVNVSRHKFQGLVGHDLIWCLYCDWMTGVWSLGSEMLRNVESFWCPIRFDSTKKCENCKIDFPDIEGTPHTPAWVPADGNMHDVTELLEKQYTGHTHNPWFAHPTRLTIDGKPVAGPTETSTTSEERV